MISFVRDHLKAVRADAYGCGAENTDEMGDGATSSIVAHCGEFSLPTESDYEEFQAMLNDQAKWSRG